MKCDRVPPHYHCDLEAGHDGPCPAWPKCPLCGNWKDLFSKDYSMSGTRYCRRCNYEWEVY